MSLISISRRRFNGTAAAAPALPALAASAHAAIHAVRVRFSALSGTEKGLFDSAAPAGFDGPAFDIRCVTRMSKACAAAALRAARLLPQASCINLHNDRP